MKRQLSANDPEDFAITENILLLFNEHDTKIALNWGDHTERSHVKESNNVST